MMSLKFSINSFSGQKEHLTFKSLRDASKFDAYKTKYKRMKRMVKDLIFENAGLCDQIAFLQEKTLLLIDERNFLLKKLQQYQSDVSKLSKSMKKIPTTIRKKKIVKPLALDSNGKPIFPIVLGGFTVHSLGEVCDKSEYHTEDLIFPVGYCSTRIYGSLKDPEKQCVYTCKVMDGGPSPKFEIVADTDLDVPLVSNSINECHSMLLQLINACLGAEVVNTKGRGADFFGISHPTIHHLIQASPGVRKCKRYVWTKFEVNPNCQYSEEENEASLSYSALLRSISFSKSHLESLREKEADALSYLKQ